MEERQGVDHRWPLCRDERAAGRDPRARSQGLEPCRPVDVKASRCKGRTFRNSPGEGLERNDARKRAAAFKNKSARLSQNLLLRDHRTEALRATNATESAKEL